MVFSVKYALIIICSAIYRVYTVMYQAVRIPNASVMCVWTHCGGAGWRIVRSGTESWLGIISLPGPAAPARLEERCLWLGEAWAIVRICPSEDAPSPGRSGSGRAAASSSWPFEDTDPLRAAATRTTIGFNFQGRPWGGSSSCLLRCADAVIPHPARPARPFSAGLRSADTRISAFSYLKYLTKRLNNKQY